MGKLVAPPTRSCKMVGVVGVPVALEIIGSSSTAGKHLVELFVAVEEFDGYRNA